MSTIEPQRTQGLPEKHGDGICVTLVTDEKNATTTVTASDSLRNRQKAMTVPTQRVENDRQGVIDEVLRLLADDLNHDPIQVGVFSNGKNGKGNGSGTMPE
ncbi:MAG: hypothetical protein PHX93_03235 [Candidatus Peribacteraceae bacterium]|nr:hypothetical protein [Candidatus Peribacteraceae bacterium]